MKLSELWLREWVNTALDSDELVEQMTMAGLEVSNVEAVDGELTGVRVGRVVACKQHPDTYQWRVAKVDVGGKRLLDIVCKATNCRVDLRVAVATTGGAGPGSFKRKVVKRRGVLSEGMLCSLSELRISEDKNCIIELPADAQIGRDLRDYIKLDDNTIDISVSPNRADCLGLLGVARDLAVINKLPLQQPSIEPVATVLSDTLPIRVDTPTACPRYLGRIVKNIDVSVSTPLWIKDKLRSCGIRSVDAVVDITNYVLLELGQPMHVFDLNSIEGGIIVRLAQQGESLTLLGGREATLTPDTIVIADDSKAIAIAGICCGALYGISLKTCDVLLECALFSPMAIIGRARSHGMHTSDASHRYERGVDPALQLSAMERATTLLVYICGGQPGPIIDVTDFAALPQPININLRCEKIEKLLGHVIKDNEVSDILIRLGCTVTSTEDGWRVRAPSWRFDIEREEDIVEEVARLYGYNNIPVKASLVIQHHREAALPLERVKTLLVDRSYQEAITYSFVDPKVQSMLHPGQEALLLPSPISVYMSAMRLSLWTGLIGAVVYNKNRQQQRIRLFESGLRFVPDKAANLGIRQDMMLAGIIAGQRFDSHWDFSRKLVDFYDVKGDLEAIFELTGQLDNIEFIAQANPALSPGNSAAIYLNGEPIGCLGVIHPKLEEKLNLNCSPLVFELLWDKVSVLKIPKVTDISRFPANRRDIAVVVAEDVCAANLIAECKKVCASQLVCINLFDVYQGSGVAEGLKSLAISLILQDYTHTLSEYDIAATVYKCVTALKLRFQASFRYDTFLYSHPCISAGY